MGKNEDEIYLYNRGNSPYWYFRYVSSTGEVVRESTKKTIRSEALMVAKKRIMELDYHIDNPSFRNALLLYCNRETNPRYIQAQKEGRLYSAFTARCLSSYFKHLYKILDSKFPKIMDKKITEITKKDIIIIKDILLEEEISDSLKSNMFKKLSPLFSYYMSIGLLEYNPCAGIIPPKKVSNEKIALESVVIAGLISRKDMFPSVRYWAFLTIAATTGMRYGELLAMNRNKINGNIYTVDSAVKDKTDMSIGLPKKDIIRIIPLSNIALGALSQIDPDENGYYFYAYYNEFIKRQYLRDICKHVYPEYDQWDDVKGWHNFRHSLNTNLLLEPDLNPALIAEYLSWEHQVQNKAMQKHYTHIYARNLQIIADRIDKIYGKVIENQLKATQSS